MRIKEEALLPASIVYAIALTALHIFAPGDGGSIIILACVYLFAISEDKK